MSDSNQARVPSGRELIDSGRLPQGWHYRMLGELIFLKHGFAFSSDHFGDVGPIVLTPGNFRLEGGLYFEPRNTKRYRGRYDPGSTFANGDLLIVMTDLTPDCNLLGKPAFVRSDEPILHNQRIGKVVPKTADLDLSFAFRALMSQQYLRRVKEMATGSTVRHTSTKSISAISIALPPPVEQRAIAAALNDVDALIGALDRLIAKKRDLKQAAMKQLLTGQTRLPGFTGKWEIQQLGDVAEFHKGRGLPKSALTPYGAESCVHYGELFTQYGETIRETISRTAKTPGASRSVANDVLMPTSDVTPRGLAKASCVLVDDVVLGGDILVIRTDPARISGTFLSHVIRQEEAQVLRLVTGTTVFHLYGADMKKFNFELPDLAEQHAIVAALSDMGTEIASLEARREKTYLLKQGMVQELLTGRTRLV